MQVALQPTTATAGRAARTVYFPRTPKWSNDLPWASRESIIRG